MGGLVECRWRLILILANLACRSISLGPEPTREAFPTRALSDDANTLADCGK
jgi:hypothetical protein